MIQYLYSMILKILFILIFIAASNAASQEIPAELILRALNHCYPERTGVVEYRDGDWTITAGNEIFYWAEGRLLPASLRNSIDLYSPFIFEVYPSSIPSPSAFSAQYIEDLRRYGRIEARREIEDLHRGLQGILFGGHNRREIENNLQRIDFLGSRISVHRDIAEALRRIDTVIRNAASEDSTEGRNITAFLNSIGQIGGYNWREIRGSNRMSYHSWGLAVDIQPRNLGGRSMYWLWEQSHNNNWMLVPLANRWMPPGKVIEAFEHEGFVWGGKWSFYDNMHFEYRPELHELNRLLASGNVPYSLTETHYRTRNRDLHHLYPDGLIP